MAEPTKVTFYAIPEAMEALSGAVAATGDTNTDTLNRAIQTYALLLAARPGTLIAFDGRTFLCVEATDG